MLDERGITVKKLILLLVFPLTFLLFSCGSRDTEINFYGMGTLCSAKVYEDSGDISEKIKRSVLNSENLLSCRIEASDISKLNRDRKIKADKDMFDVLKMCQQVSDETENRYSVLIGNLTSLWDFDSDSPKVPSDESIKKALSDIENSVMTFSDGKNISVSGNADTDMGSVGKGFACDRAVGILNENSKKGIVSVGGSLGMTKSPDGKSGFSIAVRDPFGTKNDVIGVLEIENCFVSTSGSYEKCFEYDSKKYHHILDKKTGFPYDGEFVSVTVVSDSGAVSDALSTACFLEPLDKCLEILKNHKSEAVFVRNDGSIIVTKGLENRFSASDGRQVSFVE